MPANDPEPAPAPRWDGDEESLWEFVRGRGEPPVECGEAPYPG